VISYAVISRRVIIIIVNRDKLRLYRWKRVSRASRDTNNFKARQLSVSIDESRMRGANKAEQARVIYEKDAIKIAESYDRDACW